MLLQITTQNQISYGGIQKTLSQSQMNIHCKTANCPIISTISLLNPNIELVRYMRMIAPNKGTEIQKNLVNA